jgi:hypothetical protein
MTSKSSLPAVKWMCIKNLFAECFINEWVKKNYAEVLVFSFTTSMDFEIRLEIQETKR